MARRPSKAADTPAATNDDPDNMTDDELEAALAAEANPPAEEDESAAEPEAEAPEASEDQPEEAAKADDESDDDGEPDMVPHGRLHHERERRKRSEERAERLEQRLEEILKTIGKKEEPKAEERPQTPPSLADDPAAYIEWQTEEIQRLRGEVEQTTQATQAQTQARDILQSSTSDMQAYAAERPEAKDAYTYLADRGREILAEQGVRDPMQQAHRLNEWQVNIATQAQNLGMRPAALLMAMAQENGWKPAAPAAAPDKAREAIEAIDKQEAAKAAARSMKDSGAAVETGLPDPAQVADMSDDEFQALLKKFGGDFDRMEAALNGIT